MKEIQYRSFSLNIHKKNWRLNKPNTCQFELTFKCGLHCQHCYSDCYNKPSDIKKELDTEGAKFILEQLYKAGVIWLCFTGGDPLTRGDFLDIYAYAKKKGFIITIFTNGYSMSEHIADCLEKSPPFVIEITLNAVKKKTYEEISGIKGSYEKVTAGIEMVVKRRLPLKIKTQITRQNLEELPQIKEFVERLGLKFRASSLLYARLNSDTGPCDLRISPRQILDVDTRERPIVSGECERRYPEAKSNQRPITSISFDRGKGKENALFKCSVGSGDGFYIDPYGNMISCVFIRKPAVNLLKNGLSNAHNKLSSIIRSRRFETDSKCRYCNLRDLCVICPGHALLETGNVESHIEYFCQLAGFLQDISET